MPEPPHDPLLNGFIFATILLSILTGLCLLAARRNGPLLKYEPRRPVPWNFAACLLVILLVVAAFVSPNGKAPPVDAGPEIGAAGYDEHLVLQLLTNVFIVGGFLFVIAVFSNAKRCDLGLPAKLSDFARDVLIGTVACVATLAPVLLVQTVLMKLFFPDKESSGHPLIEMVMSSEPDLTMFILAGIAAVVVAPICEEITFRLLLQGWLEKFEDSRLTLPAPTSDTPVVDIESPATQEQVSSAKNCSLLEEPPRQGIAGLPHGWFPIITSAVLFGLAHFGYGPEPAPLIVLGLVLGYLYQRTHRITPCIVCHALFNLFSMIVLWRMVFHNS